MSEKTEKYLKENVKGILQPMVKDILSQRPKDAVNKNNPIIFIFLGFIYASMAPTKIQIKSR